MAAADAACISSSLRMRAPGLKVTGGPPAGFGALSASGEGCVCGSFWAAACNV
eukprot:CAMPEP_0115834110 /NCGR_PEP_ID=MMETSP0287-20121206/3516_1 /TAXON_ID=412157 /ORGANISM="Chrysochromulina rotalis, Strain UIO044" /LENGTH=52 /DNA_ID=CAMNT_0003287539 /DNA_START=354 /DNA_END=509 /DNA_ORIENTATION=+